MHVLTPLFPCGCCGTTACTGSLDAMSRRMHLSDSTCLHYRIIGNRLQGKNGFPISPIPPAVAALAKRGLFLRCPLGIDPPESFSEFGDSNGLGGRASRRAEKDGSSRRRLGSSSDEHRVSAGPHRLRAVCQCKVEPVRSYCPPEKGR